MFGLSYAELLEVDALYFTLFISLSRFALSDASFVFNKTLLLRCAGQ